MISEECVPISHLFCCTLPDLPGQGVGSLRGWSGLVVGVEVKPFNECHKLSSIVV